MFEEEVSEAEEVEVEGSLEEKVPLIEVELEKMKAKAMEDELRSTIPGFDNFRTSDEASYQAKKIFLDEYTRFYMLDD